MQKSERLTKRQLAFLDDLFFSDLDEQTALDKHAVSRRLYEKWFDNKSFVGQFERHIAGAHRHGRTILARCAPLAATTLVQLTNSDKPETARKACLDILSAHDPTSAATSSDIPPDSQLAAPTADLPPKTASRLLAILAQQPST
ncbi:MAG: hypothetical protein A2Y77_01695 [Planctomycetes bacterium RBG_13_62_9]|nr:MAG: hypothetical protein A2Y77_01695 [Planctomycetes bacterium RBG_13_62_9]